MLEDYWEISKILNLLKDYNQKLHVDLFDQLDEFVCFLCVAKVRNINNV